MGMHIFVDAFFHKIIYTPTRFAEREIFVEVWFLESPFQVELVTAFITLKTFFNMILNMHLQLSGFFKGLDVISTFNLLK